MFIVIGLLLFLVDWVKCINKSVFYINVLIIGIVQVIVILFGIFCFGVIIFIFVFLGIDWEKFVCFFFFMVVFFILGKMVKDILDGEMVMLVDQVIFLVVGFVVVFVIGVFVCFWMISLVKCSKLIYFFVYCFIVVVIVIFMVIF